MIKLTGHTQTPFLMTMVILVQAQMLVKRFRVWFDPHVAFATQEEPIKMVLTASRQTQAVPAVLTNVQ